MAAGFRDLFAWLLGWKSSPRDPNVIRMVDDSLMQPALSAETLGTPVMSGESLVIPTFVTDTLEN